MNASDLQAIIAREAIDESNWRSRQQMLRSAGLPSEFDGTYDPGDGTLVRASDGFIRHAGVWMTRDDAAHYDELLANALAPNPAPAESPEPDPDIAASATGFITEYTDDNGPQIHGGAGTGVATITDTEPTP